MAHESPATPIQAYYKLTFPNFEYYLQTLSVTIGRRPLSAEPPHPNPAEPSIVQPDTEEPSSVELGASAIVKDEEVAVESLQALANDAKLARVTANPVPCASIDPPASPRPSSSSSGPSRQSKQSYASSAFPRIDVDLGPLKSISRLHARIDYDDSIDKFVLYVNGRNGAWVDDSWVGCGGRVALGARTKIQIATRTFYFELPPSDSTLVTPDTTPEADVDPMSADDPLQPLSPPPPSVHSPLLSSSTTQSPSRKRRRLSHSLSRSPSLSSSRRPKRRSRRLSACEAPSPPSLPPVPVDKSPAAPTHAVIIKADEQSDDDPLISINDLEQEDIDELEAMGPDRGPSDDDEGLHGKHPQNRSKAKGSSKAGKARSAKKPSKPPLDGSSHPGPPPLTSTKSNDEAADPSQPRPPKKYMTQRLIAKTQLQQVPRPPPDQMPPKPPFTYAVLCYRAINELGGKASLSEIVNWIRDKFEWYRWNDACGWESSVRHNLSSNPGFVKSRRDHEVDAIVQATGQQKKTKGFFWSIDPKAEDTFAEKEREIVEAGSRSKAQQPKVKGKEPEKLGGAPLIYGAPTPDTALASAAVAQSSSLVKAAMPVPMMAPRASGHQPFAAPGMPPGSAPHHPHHMLPPMMMVPSGSMPLLPPLPGHYGHPMFTLPPPPPQAPPLPTSSVVIPSPSPHLPAAQSINTPLATSVSGQPTFPQALSDVCLSITVGPAPPGATNDSSAPFVDGPPITLHNGSLILNPTIFAGLSAEQLEELQKLKAAKALEILTGYTKNFVKDQIVKKGKAKGKAKVAGKGSKPGSASGPTGAPPLKAVSDAPEGGPPDSASTPSTSTCIQQLDSASILAIANLASASAGPTPSTPSTSTLQPHAPPPMTDPTSAPYPYYGHYPFAFAGPWSHPTMHPPPPGMQFSQPWTHASPAGGVPSSFQSPHPMFPIVPSPPLGQQSSVYAAVPPPPPTHLRERGDSTMSSTTVQVDEGLDIGTSSVAANPVAA